MVTRSVDDWEQHKKDVYEQISHNYDESYAKKFMDFYEDRYNPYKRTFLDVSFAFKLMDDYSIVKKIGTRIIAFIGPGGGGKTTAMKNVLHFLDPTITVNNVHTDLKSFLKNLRALTKSDSEIGNENRLKAIALDEPDDKYNFQSQEGKAFKRIVGKWRQHQLFVGMCATDPADIAPFIWKKIDVLVFIPFHGQGYVFTNQPKVNDFIVQELKKKFLEKKSYAVFAEYTESSHPPEGMLPVDLLKENVLDMKSGAEYIKRKETDYIDDLNQGIDVFDPEGAKEKKRIKVDDVVIFDNKTIKRDPHLRFRSELMVYNMYETGQYTAKKISKILKIPIGSINEYIQRIRTLNKLGIFDDKCKSRAPAEKLDYSCPPGANAEENDGVEEETK